VEEVKPEGERGTYLSPEAYGQPEERRRGLGGNPELKRQIKETHSKQIEESTQKGAKR
jgi:hypothetical protein